MKKRLLAGCMLMLSVGCDAGAALLVDAGGLVDSETVSDANVSRDAGFPVDASDGLDGNVVGTCEEDLQALERAIERAFARAVEDPSVTDNLDVTLVVERADGRRIVASHGDSSLTREYESASTSKWVTAAVLLELVDLDVLSLESRPSELIGFWSGESDVDLRDLLSFTSGFAEEDRCIHSPFADFLSCVELMYEASLPRSPAPGTVYRYSSVHMQVAGAMAIEAAGVEGWSSVFDGFRERTGLFPTGRFDLPSLDNPRLAGGMTWTAEEYVDFLRALFHGSVLSEESRAAMFRNQRGDARVTASPAFAGLREDWSYGLGNWLECPTATELGSYDCGDGTRHSSAGAYGAYPFLDFDGGYLGIVAQQGRLGAGREGALIFRELEELVDSWALQCR